MPVTAKGLEGIVANETKLSDVHGDEGVLTYLGYNINDLVRAGVTFEEVIHLLHRGKLPTRAELERLTRDLRSRRSLPDGVVEFLKRSPASARPIASAR